MQAKLHPEATASKNRKGLVGPFSLVVFAVLLATVIGCAALRERRAERTFRDCDECPLMVVVPAGSFVMGDSVYGRPTHRVTIRSAFAASKDLITRHEYRDFVVEEKHSSATSSQKTSQHEDADYAVVNVNWDDTQAYVKWLSTKTGRYYRLLSESEYEYAERGGTETAFWWGDEAGPVCAYADFHDCSNEPTAVGGRLPNGFGLNDMVGNVFEWVEDCWHPNYDGAPDDGTAWTKDGCSARVMRGGAWFVQDVTPLRSSYRDSSDPRNRSEVIGFRVARDL
jgi:formylglycine-generating enzyme required for sulfatase activity